MIIKFENQYLNSMIKQAKKEAKKQGAVKKESDIFIVHLKATQHGLSLYLCDVNDKYLFSMLF